MKNLVSKKLILVFGILLIAIVAVFFFLSKNKEESISPPASVEPFSLSDCVYTDLIQTDSELNVNLSKTNIFGGIYTFLKPSSEQKEIKILGIKTKKENEVLNLEDLCSELDISIPDKITEKIAGHYFLVGFFSQLENKEWKLNDLGLVLEMNQGEEKAVAEELGEWEKTMAENTRSLALIKNARSLPPEEKKFQNGSYKKIDIRYFKPSFGLEEKALNYIFVDDKIFIATSKESIYAVIDALE